MNPLGPPSPRPTAQVAPYVNILGIDLAVEFLLTFGGAKLALSVDPKGRSQLEALVGPEKARMLGANAHRCQRRVPLAKRWLAAYLSWKGQSAANIARQLRVTDQSVRKWLKEGRLV
jgi:hypothetical protein